MPSNSKTILAQNVHPDDSTVQSVTGEKHTGDGYYGRSDGFHTVQINVTSFTGDISMEGTLAVEPTENDYFPITLSKETAVAGTVDTTGAISTGSVATVTSAAFNDETTSVSYNFTGNYVWVRAKASNWTTGSIDSILLNH